MTTLFEEKPWTEKLKSVFWVVIIVGIALVVFVIVRGEALVVRTPDSYQAVFLNNDQVYFGKLKSLNRDWLSLTDIYYLRAGSIQRETDKTGQPSGQIDLVKLGKELHAPKDEMIVNRSSVLFYEDIGTESEVMKLIREHKQGHKQ